MKEEEVLGSSICVCSIVGLARTISNICWSLERPSIELGLHSSGVQNHQPDVNGHG
jgi:hypothetical protein